VSLEREKTINNGGSDTRRAAIRQHTENFKARVRGGSKTVMVYEDPEQQRRARAAVDFVKVDIYAKEHLSGKTPTTRTGNDSSNSSSSSSGSSSSSSSSSSSGSGSDTSEDLSSYSTADEEEAFLVGLLKWFKVDFFKWYHPRCKNPASQCVFIGGSIENRGVEQPNQQERDEGWAGRTELYYCKQC
jgi:hypothetical protein